MVALIRFIRHHPIHLAGVLLAAVIWVLCGCSSTNPFVQNAPRYQRRLIEYATYGRHDTVAYPFSYNRDDIRLKNLHTTYILETIAGNGDEVSRILNLMVWVNRNLRHSGSAPNPFPPNTNTIIESWRKENRGVNCRMLATVLNEFYLSLGFASRIVTCKPYEHEFDDCHVVTVVYSCQLGRWIMMDPSFAGYFTDERDQLLGLREIRERMITGTPMTASNLLNHNGDTYTEEVYRAYLAKNLFRFSCPLTSEFGYEARDMADREYIELIPARYESPGDNYRYTRNQDVFWAKPSMVTTE